ncbi:hypothetical protein RHGRI_016870 [Rhododendron griersonianum]|uniref:GTP-binding protein TrmE N-terminal domain-containing protein n=1 Tax=Rhododendron griersonianum TaxID=479676 RepID=A0AAV6JVX6_9ERIC|nr:hypothetical protein RHGRI_016870 [Rhododendron griersonianum]
MALLPAFRSLLLNHICRAAAAAASSSSSSRDERLGSSAVNPDQVVAACSSTIAAIVTSLGGPPGAVGIVRLSGPSAVSIVARLYRPTTKKKRNKGKAPDWRPKSHVVEYGVLLDRHENVIDEVCFGIVS